MKLAALDHARENEAAQLLSPNRFEDTSGGDSPSPISDDPDSLAAAVAAAEVAARMSPMPAATPPEPAPSEAAPPESAPSSPPDGVLFSAWRPLAPAPRGPAPPRWPGPYEPNWGQADPGRPNRYDPENEPGRRLCAAADAARAAAGAARAREAAGVR